MAKNPSKPAPRGGGKGAFYRLMRDWHGYLSAFAFLALLFFSATGIFLNHPELLAGPTVESVEETVDLTADELATAKASEEPGQVITDIVGGKMKLVGDYRSGDLSGDDLFIRLEGVSGVSDLRANLATGQVAVTVSPQNGIQVMNALHRGVIAGNVWKVVIDIVAAVVIVLSVLGYILFFSMRFRVKTALILTGVSLAAMAGVFLLFVS